MKIKKDMRDMGRQSQEYVLASQSEKDLSRAREKRPSREGKIDANKVVLEYLVKNSYQSSLEAFKKELVSRNEDSSGRQILKSLLHAFDSGSNKEFFIHWEKSLLEGDVDSVLRDDLSKLEFYFQIYFCIYSIHPRGKNLSVTLLSNSSKSHLRK